MEKDKPGAPAAPPAEKQAGKTAIAGPGIGAAAPKARPEKGGPVGGAVEPPAKGTGGKIVDLSAKLGREPTKGADAKIPAPPGAPKTEKAGPKAEKAGKQEKAAPKKDNLGLLTKYLKKRPKYDIIRNKGGGEMQLKYHMVTIEDLVPENHFLRKLERSLDLSFVYEETAHMYSRKYGRPPIDPLVMVKYLLMGFLY